MQYVKDLNVNMGQILNKLTQTKTNFNDLPPEIKEDILSYLCNSNAFTAASVCQEWKMMLGSRFTEEVDTRVIIGLGNNFADNIIRQTDKRKYRCNKSKNCHLSLSPEVMLKASADHKLNVHLEIVHNHNVTQVSKVDSKVVTKGLLCVKRFTLSGRNPLLFHQLEDLFKGLERGDKVMEHVELCY